MSWRSLLNQQLPRHRFLHKSPQFVFNQGLSKVKWTHSWTEGEWVQIRLSTCLRVFLEWNWGMWWPSGGPIPYRHICCSFSLLLLLLIVLLTTQSPQHSVWGQVTKANNQPPPPLPHNPNLRCAKIAVKRIYMLSSGSTGRALWGPINVNSSYVWNKLQQLDDRGLSTQSKSTVFK